MLTTAEDDRPNDGRFPHIDGILEPLLLLLGTSLGRIGEVSLLIFAAGSSLVGEIRRSALFAVLYVDLVLLFLNGGGHLGCADLCGGSSGTEDERAVESIRQCGPYVLAASGSRRSSSAVNARYNALSGAPIMIAARAMLATRNFNLSNMRKILRFPRLPTAGRGRFGRCPDFWLLLHVWTDRHCHRELIVPALRASSPEFCLDWVRG